MSLDDLADSPGKIFVERKNRGSFGCRKKIGQVTNLPDANDLTHQPSVFRHTTFGWVISS